MVTALEVTPYGVVEHALRFCLCSKILTFAFCLGRSGRSPLIDLLVELGLVLRPPHGKYTVLGLWLWLRLIKTKFNLHLCLVGSLGFVVITRWAGCLLPDLTPITKADRELQLPSFKCSGEKWNQLAQWKVFFGMLNYL